MALSQYNRNYNNYFKLFVFKNLNLNTLGIILSFASGAILAMLADSMIPEAYEEGGYLIGLLTICGFLTAFIIYKL